MSTINRDDSSRVSLRVSHLILSIFIESRKDIRFLRAKVIYEVEILKGAITSSGIDTEISMPKSQY
jgi:hypothetical protein